MDADTELLSELARRKAIIVHCSRPGKGDEGIGGLLFPSDLLTAIDLCANRSKELCCSVIWPGHVETFGAVGIILRPRSIGSVTLISATDGGTRVDPTTGRRVGIGSPFSPQGVIDTFTRATTYNEWNVQDADTIGMFLHPAEPWDVAQKVSLRDIPGYDESMGNEEVVGLVRVNREGVAAQFPSLPIYSLSGADIVRLDDSGTVRVDASELYGIINK